MFFIIPYSTKLKLYIIPKGPEKINVHEEKLCLCMGEVLIKCGSLISFVLLTKATRWALLKEHSYFRE